jgi:hypothetical protein
VRLLNKRTEETEERTKAKVSPFDFRRVHKLVLDSPSVNQLKLQLGLKSTVIAALQFLSYKE